MTFGLPDLPEREADDALLIQPRLVKNAVNATTHCLRTVFIVAAGVRHYLVASYL